MMSLSRENHRSDRRRYVLILLTILAVFMVDSALQAALAGYIDCGTPTAAGDIRIRATSTVGGGWTKEVSVTIPALTPPNQAEQKAKIIEDKLRQVWDPSGIGLISVSRVGTKVSVTTVRRVFISVVSDATGEKNKTASVFVGNKYRYACRTPATGMSFDGVSPGSITIGTDTYVATLPTSAGQTPMDLMSAALAELTANGVSDVELVTFPTGAVGLYFSNIGPNVTMEFGADDSGVDYFFETLPETDTIPTLSEWGLIILTLLVVSTMIWFVVRRRRMVTV